MPVGVAVPAERVTVLPLSVSDSERLAVSARLSVLTLRVELWLGLEVRELAVRTDGVGERECVSLNDGRPVGVHVKENETDKEKVPVGDPEGGEAVAEGVRVRRSVGDRVSTRDPLGVTVREPSEKVLVSVNVPLPLGL